MSEFTTYKATGARDHSLEAAPKPDLKVIDIHAHVHIEDAESIAAPHVDMSDQPFVKYSTPESNAVGIKQNEDRIPYMVDLDLRFSQMDEMGVDVQVIHPVPLQSFYWVPADVGMEANRAVNEGISKDVRSNPERLIGFGTIPMQDVKLAIEELEYCIQTLNFKGVQLLTSVNGEEISDEKYEPLWARIQELDACVFLHPNGFSDGRRLAKNYFINVVGNPFDTTLAVHHLIFNGILERYPDLRILLPHGGGYLAAYSGRIDHAWSARSDARGSITQLPTTYLKKLFLDTVVFTPHQLKYLVEVFGADHIMVGTDYPYDMAEYDPVGHVLKTAGLTANDHRALLGGTAQQFLKFG